MHMWTDRLVTHFSTGASSKHFKYIRLIQKYKADGGGTLLLRNQSSYFLTQETRTNPKYIERISLWASNVWIRYA